MNIMKQQSLFPEEKVYFLRKNEDREELLAKNPYLGPKSKPIGYKNYLRSEEWKNKAKFARQLAEHTCEMCFKKKPLDVHHSNYECLYNERFNDVYILCRECHEVEDEIRKKNAAYWTYLETKYGINWPSYHGTYSKAEFEIWYEEKKFQEDNGLFENNDFYDDYY
jgi:hypothetical protein